MPASKSRTPTVSQAGSQPSSADSGNANRSFATRNPYAALENVVEARSDRSGPSKSPSSAGGSAEQHGRFGSGTAMMSPPRGPISGASPTTPQRGINDGPSQHIRHMSGSQGSLSSPLVSPTHRTPTTVNSSLGSPQQTSTPRRSVSNNYSPRTPQGLAMGGSRAALDDQGLHPHAPILSQVPHGSLTGIPEYLAVQEMAFRQGQQDYGIHRDRLPSSPFAEQFNDIWLEYYVLGREVGGTPKSSPAIQQSTGLDNFPWPVLINPYTQDLERPNGGVDAAWVVKICGLALDCMAALVASVCKRQHDWKRTVCDVPSPIRQAIRHFEDLEKRYQDLKKDAEVALAGGLPTGY